MKKSISVFLVTVLALTFLTACGGSLKVDENTIYVQKRGKVTGATVENFDKEYYDPEELQEYVDQRVADYTADHGKKSVKVDSFSVEEGVAKLNIKYASCEDYAAFNGVELFAGTVPQAMAAGYGFDKEFLAVEKGVLSGVVGKDAITADSDLKVVILNEKVDVKVDGTVTYVSADYTTLKAKDTVGIKVTEDAQDGEELALVYIVYK